MDSHIQIVDTHVHVGQYWYEPVETLLFQMDHNGVDKAVLVQFDGNYDNRYLLDCVRRYPGRFAGVVIVDMTRPEAPDDLARWAAQGAAGIRLLAGDRSPGTDPLAVWRKAQELGLPVSCRGSVEDFASEGFSRLLEELPGIRIVIEHLAGVVPEPELDYQLFRQALGIARYPNVYIKLPGFGELFRRPMPFQQPPFAGSPAAVRMAFDAFGARRMMWGSDFPPAARREGYANTLRWPLERIDFFSDEDQTWIFGQTALSVWRFE